MAAQHPSEPQMRATFHEAAISRMTWAVSNPEMAAAAIEKLGVDPEPLAERWNADRQCVLAVVRPGPIFEAGQWFSRTTDDVFLIVVCVDEARYEALRGTNPGDW